MVDRIESLDIAKGFGIILVVFGHTTSGSALFNKWIYIFHMPLFFIISGICFSESKYPVFRPFLIKRIKQLIVPLLCFTFLHLVLLLSYKDLQQLFLGTLPGALWFLLILFLAESLYWAYSTIKNKIFVCSLLFFGGVISVELCMFNVELPFSLSVLPLAISFFCFGNIMRDPILMMLKTFSDRCVNYLFAAILLIVPFVLVKMTGQSLNMKSNQIPSPVILYISAALIGSLGIFALSSIPYNKYIKRIFLFLGRNTMVILGSHMILIYFSSVYLSIYFQSKVVYKTFELLFISLGCFCVITLINKFAPWMAGKSSKQLRK